MQIFKNEKHVRLWVREELHKHGIIPRFIEPALGSTQGLPDCFFTTKGKVIFCELKCAERLADGGLRYKVKPEQARELPKMVDDGFNVVFLIAVKNEPLVLLTFPHAHVLSGKLKPSQIYNLPTIKSEGKFLTVFCELLVDNC